MDVTLSDEQWAAVQQALPEITAFTPPYKVGDTVYLDDTPFKITNIGSFDIQLRDPALIYPIFRSESRENFERLLRQDSRNGPITEFLAADLEHTDADLREALTSGLLEQKDKENIAGYFRENEGNTRVAQRLSDTYAGTSETMELTTGDTADFFATTTGVEVDIHDKYNSKRSARWEEIAPILRALYEQEQDGFFHEPVLRKPANLDGKPSYQAGDQAVLDYGGHELSGTVGYVGEKDVRIDTGPYSWSHQTVSRDAFENGIRQDERNADLFTPEQPAAENFHITDDHLGEGGAKVKYGYNIAAIRTLKTIEAEGRTATPEEQETLSRYVGWGGIPQAFDADNASWSKEYAELVGALTTEEYEMARSSTLNAHYTSPTVIKAIYEAVGDMGFQTGNILEPACGVGNFFGLLPESMAASRLYGVELDSITGRIAKQLYPDADITVAGFETTDRRDFFDIAVGNVPFGQYQVNDRAYNKLGFSIHDYFFAKTLDQVRAGGVIAFVTSRYTMDKQSPEVRHYIARRAELLGAIRLPNNAFKSNAGTEVVSDIIFLQKRDRPIVIEPDWVHLGQNEDGFAVNSYFIEHPEMILGRQTSESTQYGRQEFTVEPIEGLKLSDQLHDAVKYIHGRYTEEELPDLGEEEKIDDSIPADPDVKNYSYTVVDGKVYYRENSRMVRPELNDTAKERVKGMVELRDCVHKLIGQQLDGFISDETIRETQAELNRLYDNFAAKYGLINSRGNSLAFSEDSSYYLLCSLEVIDEDGNMERKADMFTKRTIKQQRVVTSVDTASEALALSIAEKARVDMDYMASLTDKTPEALADELRGVIFRLPEPVGADENPCYVTSDEYLSGNVREKLREAEHALAVSDVFQPNVEALKAAQPKDLDASEIEVRLGATWIGKEYIQEFMYELLNPPSYLRNNIQVNYAEFTAEWNITGKNSAGYNNVAAYVTYGTDRANAYRILEDTLNLRDVRIYDTVTDPDGKERRVLNSKETTLAQQKQQAIKDAFRDWIWKDPERRQILTKKYNELFNSCRPREYDGRHITFSGINPEITLREHQLNAVAHILYGGNTLLAHEVGAGKTFEMVAAAMESKRLGLCQKSLFAVPNHLTEQWASEFLRLYPSANILVATKKDFETRNRKKFCARIATGDYDAVIIGHSQFERIPVSIERQERLLQEQIWEIEDGLEELKDSGAERFTIKQLERTKKGLETRLKKLNDTSRKDDVVTFEQLGVDRLYVDEAHNYKNLFLYTKMRNVAGLSTSDAQKSSDMLLKCRYIDEITDSRGVVFATGTPVSNSMTELYTMMRYLQHGTLQQQGLAHFDCWASTFGETTTAIELAPEGTGYRARTRFAKFFNLPELMTLWKEAADIKTADQLDLPTPTPVYHNEVAQPTDIQKEMVQELSKRAAAVHSGTVDPSVDNMLKITSDGRKLGLDQRVINPMLPDDPGSKVNMCVNNIYRVWDKGQADKLTQLVFCDISTPKGHASQQAAKAGDKTINGVELHALEDALEPDAEPDTAPFTVYDDIRGKLIARGIPAEQIAFIHDANTEVRKKELFAKVRAGQVRVLMGSTFKMGAGMNVQDRLIALHDLDCPWRPGDLEQRSGRIIRQGNGNPEVHIFRYVTEGTFDAYLWQTIENKQKFISQIMTSKSPVRSCEDIDETALSYAEIKALCAGDERIKEKMDLDIDVSKLRLLKASHQSQQYRLEDNLLKYFPEQIERNKGFIAGLEADMKTLAEHPHPKDGFVGMVVRGDTLTDKDNAGAAILEACKEVKGIDPLEIGSYRGFTMSLSVENFAKDFILTLKGQMTHRVTLGTDARGNLTRIDNALAAMPERLKNVHSQLDNLYSQMAAAKSEIGKPFPQEAELQEKSARLAELNALLDIDGKAPAQQQTENVMEKSERPSVLESLKTPCVCGSVERKTKHEMEAR
jgi:N12 class adenine-specific DNA methylase